MECSTNLREEGVMVVVGLLAKTVGGNFWPRLGEIHHLMRALNLFYAPTSVMLCPHRAHSCIHVNATYAYLNICNVPLHVEYKSKFLCAQQIRTIDPHSNDLSVA